MTDNEETPKELAGFLNIWDSWRFGYTRVFCKYLVSKCRGGEDLLYGMVGFTNEAPRPEHQNVFIETSQCIASQEIFDLTQEYADKIIKNLKENANCFQARDKEFVMPARDSQRASFFFDPLAYPRLQSFVRSPYIRVSGDGDYNLMPDTKVLDLELRCLDKPYEDTNDMLVALGFPLDTFQSSRNPHIEYILTAPTSNILCEIENKSKLKINAEFPNKPEKVKFNVGVKLFNNFLPETRFKIKSDEFSWSEEDGKHKASIEKEFENIVVARVLPEYDDHNIGSLTAIDPDFTSNVRPEIHNVFYEKEPIEKFIFSSNSDEFEFGITTLLHYLRLSTHRYSGVKRLTDGPDVVAFSNAGHTYIVECTIGSPNHKGKLLKLHNRAEKLRQHFQTKGLSVELIRPIVFTNISKENIHEDRAEAANYRISIVTKEDYEDLINRIPNPPSEQELYEAALNAIPTKEQDKQYPLAING